MADWTDISDDPNDPEIHRARQAAMDAARHPQISDRIAFIVDRVRGRRVLDIGCVQHTVDAEERDTWLHRHVATAAAECVGADIHADGVRALQAKGYDVVEHDVLSGPGPLADRGPFDVIVCGELIEHLPDPQQLLTATAALLAPGGEIIVTTPNPYAPFRTAAGARLDQWENADHITYLFPAGMALMANRAGLELDLVTSSRTPGRISTLMTSLGIAGAVARAAALLGPLGRPISQRMRGLAGRDRVPLGALLTHWRRWDHAMLGETAYYVARHVEPVVVNNVQARREPSRAG